MGNCVNNSKDLHGNTKCHVITYSWKGTTDMINFTAKDTEFATSDFLLTKSGYFVIDTERSSKFNWLKEYGLSARTENLPAFKVQLNDTADGLPNQLVNISANQKHFNNAMWDLINFDKSNLAGKGVEINEGDIIKIGKQIMKFKIIRSKVPKAMSMKNLSSMKKIPNNVKSMMELHQHGEINYQDMCNSVVFKDNELLCRVCLEPESAQNPFHDLCICNKTMPTHLSCFRAWLQKNSTVTESNDITFYNFMHISCEVCKTQFASSIKVNGKDEPILEPKLPDDIPYAFVEVFQIEDPSKIKAFLIVDLSKDRKITIGRNEENDIIFKNNSISRNHCTIKIDKGKLKIIDQNSKFGTFKMILGFLDLKSKKNTLFKIDKYLVEIHPFEKKPCDCVKEKNSQNLEINPYKQIDEFAMSAPRKVQTMNDFSNGKTLARDFGKKDKVKDMFKHKPITLDYIPEIDEKYEESHLDSKMGTLKSNKLANTLVNNQIIKKAEQMSHSIEEFMEDELDNSLKNTNGSFKHVLMENTQSKKSNFYMSSKQHNEGLHNSLDSIESEGSLLESNQESEYVFN